MLLVTSQDFLGMVQFDKGGVFDSLCRQNIIEQEAVATADCRHVQRRGRARESSDTALHSFERSLGEE